MIPARKSRLFNAWFAGVARKRLTGSFSAVYVRGLEAARQAAAEHPVSRAADHPRVHELTDRARERGGSGVGGAPMLQALLELLREIAPVPLSLALFATGTAGIHHVHRAQRASAGGAAGEGGGASAPGAGGAGGSDGGDAGGETCGVQERCPRASQILNAQEQVVLLGRRTHQ